MSIIALPDNKFRSINWVLVQPTQVNRSEFTSARQVMQLPGASYWRASADHVAIVGENGVRRWRSFFARLRGQANTFALPATEGQQSQAGFYHPGAPTPVNDGANVTFSPNLRDVTSAASSPAWGVAYAFSTGSLLNGARALFRAGQTNLNLMAGLNDSVSGAGGWEGINFAINASENGRLYIYESGTYRGDFGPYSTDDMLGVFYGQFGASWQVRYYRNAELLRTVSGTPGDVYRFEAQLFAPGSRLLDASFTAPGGPAAGSTSVTLQGFAASQLNAVEEGWMATAIFADNAAQLVTFTSDANADAGGVAVASFEPMLRDLPIAIVTGRPFALVAMDAPELGYSVDPGAIYGFGFSATEAF